MDTMEHTEPEDSTENQPTTSRAAADLDPEADSHNMNDLKPIDFNSADEIRQAMKAMMTGNIPSSFFEESHQGIIPEVEKRSLASPTHSVDVKDHNITIEIEDQIVAALQEDHAINTPVPFYNTSTSRKRRGRPAKPGTSKKIQKVSRSMYEGKLSNLVRFKKGNQNDSGFFPFDY